MRRISSLTLGCALMAALSTACGSADDQQSSESKIYGGTKVPSGEWLSTVALVSSSGIFCTGTAISPKVVVTAAHCASGTSASRLKIYTGDGKDGGYVTGQYAVSKIKASPKYSSRGNDIAYIVLKDELDLPESAYVPVLTDADEIAELNAVGATARIVGYGNRNGNILGTKYQVEAKVVSRLSGMSHDAATEIAVGGGGKDSCQGDSGGPVYGQLANGDWRVYGVTSRGGACGTGGIYGLMAANICWIQSDSGVDLGLAEGTCDAVAQPPVEEEQPTTSTGSWWNDWF